MGEIIGPSIAAPFNKVEEQVRYDSDYHDLSRLDTPKSSLEHKVAELTKRKKWIYFNPKTDIQDVKFCKCLTFNTVEYFKDTVIKYSIAQRYDVRFVK